MKRCVSMICLVWVVSLLSSQTSTRNSALAQNHDISIRSMRWRADGNVLAIAAHEGLWLYDKNLQLIATLSSQNFDDIAWRSDGIQLASIKYIDTSIAAIDIWDVSNLPVFQLVRTIHDTGRLMDTGLNIDWNPFADEVIVNGADANLWDVASGNLIRTFDTQFAITGAMTTRVAWSPNPQNSIVAIPVSYGYISLWNSSTGLEIARIAHNQAGHSLAWNSAGTLIATNDQNVVTIWNLQGEEVVSLQGHTDHIFHIVWVDNILAASGRDQKILVWETISYELIETINAQTSSPIAIHPTGESLVYINTMNLLSEAKFN